MLLAQVKPETLYRAMELRMHPQHSVGMQVGAGITVVPYDPMWPEEFARVRTELLSALASAVLSVDHVGSTSVPGLDAKPIIDILVSVPSLEESLTLAPTLGRLGFEYRRRDELPDRHYFPRTVGGLRRHHVSLAEPGSWHHRNSLTFRDALRRDADLARRYGELKRRLASEVGSRRLEYQNGKTDFILGVLRTEGCEIPVGYPIHFVEARAV